MKRFFKWGAIGCGGLIGLFILLVILAAIFGSSEEAPPPGSSVVQTESRPTRSTATPAPTATPVAESDDALACEWSAACAVSGLERDLWARVFQECAPDADCRLQASASDISARLERLLSVESRQSPDGSTAYRATSDDGQRSVTWMDKNGVVFMDMSATVPYDFSDISTEVLVRDIANESVPGPWDFDVAASIASTWSVFYTQPASVWSEGPDAEISYGNGGEVNGVAMRVYYIPLLSKAGVVFEVSR